MTRKISTFMMALLLFAGILFSTTEVHAANVCSTVKSNGFNAVTFTVKTKGSLFSSEYIKFSFTNGTAYVGAPYGTVNKGAKKDSSGRYVKSLEGEYLVKIRDTKTNKIILNKRYSGSFKISSLTLKKNSAYEVTVTPVHPKNDGKMTSSLTYFTYNSFKSWKVQPSWQVTKTGGNITLCK